jgi:hypothetical protein
MRYLAMFAIPPHLAGSDFAPHGSPGSAGNIGGGTRRLEAA